MAQATTYSFEAKIAPRGYHVYKNTTWVNAKEGDEVQVEIDTNFFIEKEEAWITEKVLSVNPLMPGGNKKVTHT